MNSRLKGFGFPKRKSAVNVNASDPPQQYSPPGPTPTPPLGVPSPSPGLPMSHPNAGSQPPNYVSPPLPPRGSVRNQDMSCPSPAPTRVAGGPPPIPTGSPYPPSTHGMGQPPLAGMGSQGAAGGPPGFGGQVGYPPGAPPSVGGPMAQHQRVGASDSDGGGKKAQLIVGIDFVSTTGPAATARSCSPKPPDRAPPSLALPSPSRPTTKPRKTSSQNGLAQALTPSKRFALSLPRPRTALPLWLASLTSS